MFEMERDWLGSLPKYEEAQWLNIFPEAKKRYGKYIKGRLKIEKKYLVLRVDEVKQRAIKDTKQVRPEDSWRDSLIRERRDKALLTIGKRIRTIEALITLIESIGNTNTNQTKIQKITESMIQRAREYPLENLIEFNRAGFTRCFAHNDKKPSAYCKKNFIHCFVCQKSWDTIAVLMDRDGLKFRDAVLQLQ